ncbi:MAG: PIN domain-containing protein [Burkholderiaceae bacterium]
MTYIELAKGCRDKTELTRLQKGPAARHTEIIPITPAISRRAAGLIASLELSRALRLADALIGATAMERQATLITADVGHFSAVEGLHLEAFEP